MRKAHPVSKSAKIFLRVLGHPIRLAIVDALAGGERMVKEIVAAIGAPQAVTSQQLKILRDFDILAARRDGNCRYYRIAQPAALKVLACLRSVLS